jgi:hypothetical protein
MLTIATKHPDPSGDLLRPFLWLLSQPLFWAALGVVVGPYLFYRGFRLFQRKQLILDIPRSSVRAAAIGAVEVSGKAVGPYTLVSPLSSRDCLYYRVVIRVFRERNRRMIIDEVCAPLFVDDGTGELMIYPAGAEMQWAGVAGDGGEYLTRVLARHGCEREDLVDAQEYCIVPEDNIFILGTLRENPWATRDPGASSLSRIGPGFVSLDEADLLRREAFTCLNPNLPSGGSSGKRVQPVSADDIAAGRKPIRNFHPQPARSRIRTQLEIRPVYLGRPALDVVGAVGNSRPPGKLATRGETPAPTTSA